MAKEGVRDPEGTKAAVLDAAEALFAARGYDAVSLQEVGEEAGVSRGTPSYFFGSKKGLYRAVVERMAEDVRSFVAGPHSGPVSGGLGNDAGKALAAAIGGYVDFLASLPNFVSLVGREVLDAGRLSEGEPGLTSLAEVLGDPGGVWPRVWGAGPSERTWTPVSSRSASSPCASSRSPTRTASSRSSSGWIRTTRRSSRSACGTSSDWS